MNIFSRLKPNEEPRFPYYAKELATYLSEVDRGVKHTKMMVRMLTPLYSRTSSQIDELINDANTFMTCHLPKLQPGDVRRIQKAKARNNIVIRRKLRLLTAIAYLMTGRITTGGRP